MVFSPEFADIRFGCGLSPAIAPPASVQAMLDGLTGPDEMAARFPIDGFAQFRPRLIELRRHRKAARDASGAKEAEARDAIKALKVQAGADRLHWFGQSLLRWVQTPQGFRERLAAFWTDHFTAQGKGGLASYATSTFAEDAIRPNLAGRFADLLIASTTHPVMLGYLDQADSIGPGSAFATGKKRRQTGLNENLAREVMELHTLGVDGPYSQADVRQLAELFTGLSFDAENGFRFRPAFAEPGAEQVLGRSYGGDGPADLGPVRAVLHDLAVHPATARHIARKLAVHFVADAPEPDLVAHIEARYLETGGDLAAVYGALLEHPASWGRIQGNVKPPADFMASACRALVLSPEQIARMKPGQMRRAFLKPMALMGQPWQKPGGPDGWPEEDMAWVTPQGVSARLRWALTVPRDLRPDLPDPRAFVTHALGAEVPAPVRFAAESAESRADAIGLVLASPAFQRR